MKTKLALLVTLTSVIILDTHAGSAVRNIDMDAPDLIQDFPVGNSPGGITFDGTNIWCANEEDDTVTKLRASDGTLQGTFPVGRSPRFLAFDGANIWVTNLYANSVASFGPATAFCLAAFRSDRAGGHHF